MPMTVNTRPPLLIRPPCGSRAVPAWMITLPFRAAIWGPRQRRASAHAARVTPSGAIANAFEVLRRLHCAYRAPIGYPEQTHLRPVEELLDHHPTTRHSMINSDLSVAGNYHAFAGCQAIGFDDKGRPELVKCLINLVTRQAFSEKRGRYSSCSHDLLGECLAAFDLGR